MEVYPFQRVLEPAPGRRNRNRRKKISVPSGLIWNRLRVSLAGARNSLWGLFTVENLLLAVGAILMSRAFILAELLPFIFAFVVAFGYKNRPASFIIILCSLTGFGALTTGLALWSNILTIFLLVLK